ADYVNAGQGADVVTGLGGNDFLVGGAGDDSLDGGADDDSFIGGAGNDAIEGGAGIDAAVGYAAGFTLKIGTDGRWIVSNGTETDTLTNVEKVTIGATTYLLVDKAADGGFASIQQAVNAANGGETILVAPGTYAESEGHDAGDTVGYRSGLTIDKANLTIQAVAADGTPISSAAAAGAVTVQSLFINTGSDYISVTDAADGLTLVGLNFTRPAGGIASANTGTITGDVKAFLSVHADGVEITGSVFSTTGASYAIELSEYAAGGVDSYDIHDNVIGKPIWLLSGAGDGLDDGNEIIRDNVFTGSIATGSASAVYLQGVGVAGFESADPFLPDVFTGNSFNDAIPAPVLIRTNVGNTPAGLATAEDLAAIVADNFTAGETWAYVLDGNGDPRQVVATATVRDVYVASSVDALNRIQQGTIGAPVPASGLDTILAGDTLVLNQPGTSSITLFDNDLTVVATAATTDLTINLAALGSNANTGAVTTITLGDAALGVGADVDVTGNGLDNVITGNAGNNTLNGNGGGDTLSGGAGSDFLIGDSGDDVLEGGAGSDIVSGGAGIDRAVFAGDFSSYTVVRNGGTYIVTDGTDTDTVTGVESFTFGGRTQSVIDNPDAVVTVGPSIVSILDADDGTATLTVQENAAAATPVAFVTASDPNLGTIGDVLTFSLVTAGGGTYTGPYAITKTGAGTATITVTSSPDFEVSAAASFVVKVTDAGGASATQAVTIAVTDVNETPTALVFDGDPVFENDTGVIVGEVSATDPDGDTLVYSVSDERFEIRTITGEGSFLALKSGVALDFETDAPLSVTLTATDADGASVSNTVAIDLRDINEAPTAIALDNNTVDENQAGATVGILTVSDPDAGDTVSYTVNDARFEVVEVSGQAILKLVDGSALDFEDASVLNLTVGITATDGGGATFTKDFTIVVNDVDEAATGAATQTV
ncbi:beta strand repeat-containing protein, partial [Methylobacterium sp. Leaf399]|uniref:beta strand repeat-containing protein n=1 Tax=Methylobacterium sp. Leaf399 TaxID=1736364 RepID=UPI00237929DB